MTVKSSTAKYLALFLLSTLLFGSSGIVASGIPLSSSQVCLVRFSLGAVSMVLVFLATRQRFPAAPRKDYCFVALSGMCLGACMIMLFEAYRLIGVGLGSVLCATAPVITMALSPILFKERLRPIVVLGFAAVLGGLILLNVTVFANPTSLTGVLLGLGAAVATSGMVVFNKLAPSLTGIPGTTLQLLGAFAVVAMASANSGGFAFIAAIPAASWPVILLFGTLFTAAAYTLYYRSIDVLPIQTVSVCAYAEPFTAVVLGSLVLGEALAPIQILGALCIVVGALLGVFRPTLPLRPSYPLPRLPHAN